VIIADNGHVSRYIFMYYSIFFDETDCLCINASLTSTFYIAEVNGVWVRGYVERNIEKWNLINHIPE